MSSAIVSAISQSLGLPFQLARNLDDGGLRLRPAGVHPDETFAINVRRRLAGVTCQLDLGIYSRALVEEMGKSSTVSKSRFAQLAKAAVEKGAVVKFRINELQANPIAFNDWPDAWHSIELELAAPAAGPESFAAEAVSWGTFFCGLVLCLAAEEDNDSLYPEEEGDQHAALASRYERSRTNRLLCITKQGVQCKCCGFVFEELYGEIGTGFIHVHHTKPISRCGPGYVPDPEQDLVVVCANCHAMLHRRSPPYLVEELQSRIQRTGSQA